MAKNGQNLPRRERDDMKNARFIVIGIMMILMFIGGYKNTACAVGEYKAQLILERY